MLDDNVVRHVGNILMVDWNVITVNMLKQGMLVELEHGIINVHDDDIIDGNYSRINNMTNVTNDNLILTAGIVLAHYTEGKDYYKKLEILELELKEENHGVKINPFINIQINKIDEFINTDGRVTSYFHIIRHRGPGMVHHVEHLPNIRHCVHNLHCSSVETAHGTNGSFFKFLIPCTEGGFHVESGIPLIDF